MEQKKIQQHYVFKMYLKSWEDQGGHFFVSREGKIYKSNAANSGKEGNFYRITSLNYSEKQILDCITAELLPPPVKNAVNTYLSGLTAIEYFDKFASEVTSEVERDILVRIADIARNNLPENYYSDVESELMNYILHILENPKDFGGNLNNHKIIRAISIQYFRTRKMRDKMKTWIPEYCISKNIDVSQVDSDNISKVILWAIGDVQTNMLSSAKISLLYNDTKEQFITSDQPVINIATNYSDEVVPNDAIFYYPISPNYALLISNSIGNISRRINEKEAIKLNAMIASASDKCIYAQTESSCRRANKDRNIKKHN